MDSLVRSNHIVFQNKLEFMLGLSVLLPVSVGSVFAEDAVKTVEEVLQERCDGNRNVLHACVSMCLPTSAHELGETSAGSDGASGGGSSGPGLGNKLDTIKGAVDALAAAVAAAVRSSSGSSGAAGEDTHRERATTAALSPSASASSLSLPSSSASSSLSLSSVSPAPSSS